MSKVIVGMTMSLDGYVTDRSGSLAPLYTDFESFIETELMKEAIEKTGAVVMGRNAFDVPEDPDGYAVDYEFQVPIFVLTHHLPSKHPKENELLTITFVTDGIESAIRQAKSAAGDKDVTVIGGASTIRQCLQAGLADELHIDIMPLLLCGGLRLFDDFDLSPIYLKRLEVATLPEGRTHIKFSIEK